MCQSHGGCGTYFTPHHGDGNAVVYDLYSGNYNSASVNNCCDSSDHRIENPCANLGLNIFMTFAIAQEVRIQRVSD